MMKAEDLKNSILQMAMQGKLVPQNPEDEPATLLLEKIKQEKEQLIKDKKIKRNNKESSIWKEEGHWYEKIGKNGEINCITDEMPFEIPDNWEILRLENICNLLNIKKSENNEYPYLNAKYLRTLDNPTIKNSGSFIKKGSEVILVDGENSGEIFVVPCDGYMGSTFRYLFTMKSMYKPYILKFIESYKTMLKNSKTGAAIPHLNKKLFNQFLIGIPPYDEQKRIVEKLEQILPQIEQYAKYEEQLTKLNKELPEKLKKSILQQAIQGKLVPQNPNDEPANILLEKIKQEKEQLIKDKKIKRNKNESTIYKKDGHWYEVIDKYNEVKCIDEEIPFEIPKTWEWTKLDNISFITKLAGFEYSKYISNNIIENGIPLIKAKNLKKGKILNVTSFISEELSDSLTRSQLLNKCILTPYVGASIGNIIIFSGKYKAHLAPNVAKIEIYGSILEEYVKLYLESLTGYKQLTKYIKSTAQPSISMSAIRDIYIPIPPIDEQKNIIKRIESLPII